MLIAGQMIIIALGQPLQHLQSISIEAGLQDHFVKMSALRNFLHIHTLCAQTNPRARTHMHTRKHVRTHAHTYTRNHALTQPITHSLSAAIVLILLCAYVTCEPNPRLERSSTEQDTVYAIDEREVLMVSPCIPFQLQLCGFARRKQHLC